MHLCYELCTQIWSVLIWIVHVWFGALSNWEICELLKRYKDVRHATKIVQSLIKDKSYHDHLVSLNLPSLLYRRRMEVIMVYLIVKGLKRISFDRLFTYCDLPTRSNGYKLYKNHCHLNVKKILFSKEYQ